MREAERACADLERIFADLRRSVDRMPSKLFVSVAFGCFFLWAAFVMTFAMVVI